MLMRFFCHELFVQRSEFKFGYRIAFCKNYLLFYLFILIVIIITVFIIITLLLLLLIQLLLLTNSLVSKRHLHPLHSSVGGIIILG